jgi:Ca-activated chloride channel family protein
MDFSDDSNLQQNGHESSNGRVELTLEARPDRVLIRPSGSRRHVDFVIRVSALAARVSTDRAPLAVALVVDRSGSMSGDKLPGAKRAALAVLDRLDERDQVAVVIFDEQLEVIQDVQPVTPALRARCRAKLDQIQPRGSTALHEGWLTGCHAIASSEQTAHLDRLARCFLLTDGIANVGLTDPETIATQAASVRRDGGVVTSTFGFGADYNESLLGPMAVAGGGQFHNLRTIAEIANTFVGELGDMLAAAAGAVRLELDPDPGVTFDVISEYWVDHDTAGTAAIAIGDLLAGEEKRVVARFSFPDQGTATTRTVRARLTWNDRAVRSTSPWQEIRFSYASHAACDAEARDPFVMRDVGLAHAARAQREASQLAGRGDIAAARSLLQKVAARIAQYAGTDADLHNAIAQLRDLERQISEHRLDAMAQKEVHFHALRSSRMQTDKRSH